MSQPAPTNLPREEVVMDRRPGSTRNPRYYCLPPFRGNPGSPPPQPQSGYRYHLVWQGYQVGTFDTWAAAKTSLSGFKGSGNKGFNTVEECIEAWQAMCPLGIHPHPVEPPRLRVGPQQTLAAPSSPAPSSPPSSPTPSSPPSSSPPSSPTTTATAPVAGPVKLEGMEASVLRRPLMYDLTVKQGDTQGHHGHHAKWNAHGPPRRLPRAPARAQQRYESLQRQGREPDILVTRSFLRASRFALDVSDEGEDTGRRLFKGFEILAWECVTKAQTALLTKVQTPLRRQPSMPRAGTTERQRARTGEAAPKRGRKAWVHGSKLVFMTGYKNEFVKATELGKVQAGNFYRDVTVAYLKIYGYNTPLNGDLREGQDVASDVDEDEDVDSLDAVVGEARSAYFEQIREKIGYWFRQHYGSSIKIKKPTNFKALFNMEELEPAAPVAQRITNFYSRKCYTERIKPRFDARWAVVSKRVPPPHAIVVQNAVIKEAWEAESAAFQAEMRIAMDAEHAAAMKAYETVISGEAPKTPEEYQLALDNAGCYLQPFIEAVGERFGMNVSLLMCGPTPDRGGAIEMHSVHSGKSKGLVPRVWTEYDRAGFEATRRSFREFSERCFSSDDRRARSLGGMPELPPAEEAPAAMYVGGSGGVPTAMPLGASGGSGTGMEDEDGDGGGNGDDGDGGGNDDDEDMEKGEGGGNDDGEEIEKGGGEEDEEEEEGYEEPDPILRPRRNVNAVMNAELKAEVAAMSREKADNFRARVRWSMPEYELLKANNSARNKVLLRSLVAKGASEIVGIGGKGLEKEKEKEKRQKRMPVEPPGSPRVTRARAAGAAEERARPTPAYKGAALGVPLVRPEDDASSFGPFLPVVVVVPDVSIVVISEERDAPLVRPEDDASSFGPFLPVVVVVPDVPVVVISEERDAPLVRPEDDASSFGPFLPVVVVVPDVSIVVIEQEEGDLLWGAADTGLWTAELRSAVRGFARLRTLGGQSWRECVEGLIALERAWGFKGKGMVGVPGKTEGRPMVVTTFMRDARKWETPAALEVEVVGPRTVSGSFSAQWWTWWGVAQPEGRKSGEDETLRRAQLKADEWSTLGKTYGRGGMLLAIGCLLWWGDAVAESGDALLVEDWMEAVRDVGWVLGEVGRVVGALVKNAEKQDKASAKETKTKAAKEAKEAKEKVAAPDTRGRKRKGVEGEKENEEHPKRRGLEARHRPRARTWHLAGGDGERVQRLPGTLDHLAVGVGPGGVPGTLARRLGVGIGPGGVPDAADGVKMGVGPEVRCEQVACERVVAGAGGHLAVGCRDEVGYGPRVREGLAVVERAAGPHVGDCERVVAGAGGHLAVGCRDEVGYGPHVLEGLPITGAEGAAGAGGADEEEDDEGEQMRLEGLVDVAARFGTGAESIFCPTPTDCQEQLSTQCKVSNKPAGPDRKDSGRRVQHWTTTVDSTVAVLLGSCRPAPMLVNFLPSWILVEAIFPKSCTEPQG
ncbi:hypothetical protein C8R46DRAFT_1294775 [Mycena filopes]|nr:hypothetical protein C8R46DRAFT_1294775 [Mycena filopes]